MSKSKMKKKGAKLAHFTFLSILREENEGVVAEQQGSNVAAKEHSNAELKDDISMDPAKIQLMKAEEAKRRRQQEEVKIALEKIQGRIDYTITEYEGTEEGSADVSSTNLEMIQDPKQLFHLLADPEMRSRYRQKLTVFIVGYEEKREELEDVLSQLNDFFVENQAGGTADLLDEVAEEELDLDSATEELGGALATAQGAVEKLVKIKKEINRLVAIMAAYPDTNKGRKKMEKALLSAQEEVAIFSKNLDEVQATLKESAEKNSQLQTQLDLKTQECTKLRKTADQAKLLEVGNDKLKRELEEAKKALKASQESLGEAKRFQQIAAQNADKKEVSALRADLEAEKAKNEKLAVEMESLVEKHAKEVEALKAEHEAETTEVRGRFEDQLKSLMEEDVFAEEDMENEGEKQDEDVIEDVDQGEIETVPAESSPAAEEAIDVISRTPSSTSVAEKKEMQAKLMQNQMEDLKMKSRKMIALLQSELSDAKSKSAAEREKSEALVDELKGEMGELESLNDKLKVELAALKEENAALSQSIHLKDSEMQTMKEKMEANGTVQDGLAKCGVQSPMQSVSTVPMVALEEDPYGHPESQLLMSAVDLVGEDQFPSTEHSIISMDPVPLGSPLQSCPLSAEGSFLGMQSHMKQSAPQSTPPQCSLPMLALSRLSHHSTMNQNAGIVHHSHPVVIEWGKAYDSIIKFKESLIGILTDHQHRIPQLTSFVKELKSVELHSLDQRQDVQGQVTEMRFSLALLLHQIEQMLQDSFAQVLAEIEAQDMQQVQVAAVEPALDKETKTMITRLTKQMRQSEAHHKAEVEKYEDTIAHLSNKLESMKMQMAQLRKAIPSRSDRDNMIMFTRLDSQRNANTLKKALEKNRISPATVSHLASGMETYLSIPGQRLATLSHRYQEKARAMKLIQQVRSTCADDPAQAASIVRGIVSRENHRQDEFGSTMSLLTAKRKELAHSLTDTLRNVESETKLFLIKPIYSQHPPQHPPDLVTSLPRPPPPLPPPSHPPTRPWTTSETGRPHPPPRTASSAAASVHRPSTSSSSSNVRRIQTFLQSQRQHVNPQDLKDSINAANCPEKSTSVSPVFGGKSGKRGHSSRPLSSLMVAHPSDSPVTTAGVWNTESSAVTANGGGGRGEGAGGEGDVGSDATHLKPTFSKMLELDLSRQRHQETMLGQIFPKMHYQQSRASVPLPPGSHRHTPSPFKLLALPEESPHVSTSDTSQVSSKWKRQQLDWKRSMASVEVPSRTDTLAIA